MTDEHIALLQRVEQCAPDLAGQVRELIDERDVLARKVEAVEGMPVMTHLVRGRYLDGREIWFTEDVSQDRGPLHVSFTPWEALNGK